MPVEFSGAKKLSVFVICHLGNIEKKVVAFSEENFL